MLTGKKNRIITGYTPNFVRLGDVTKFVYCFHVCFTIFFKRDLTEYPRTR